MSKRHTMGVSKWLPSTEDKITFELTFKLIENSGYNSQNYLHSNIQISSSTFSMAETFSRRLSNIYILLKCVTPVIFEYIMGY